MSRLPLRAAAAVTALLFLGCGAALLRLAASFPHTVVYLPGVHGTAWAMGVPLALLWIAAGGGLAWRVLRPATPTAPASAETPLRLPLAVVRAHH